MKYLRAAALLLSVATGGTAEGGVLSERFGEVLPGPEIFGEVIASKPNQGGGQIFLTSKVCGLQSKPGSHVFSTDSLGAVTVTGCAFEMGPKRMLIDWGGGRLNVIDDAWLPETAPKAPSGGEARYIEMRAEPE